MYKLKTINKKIQELHPTFELHKGRGYFYFSSTDEIVHGLDHTSVYVYKLNDLTLEQWIEEANKIKDKIRESN